jgi:hypothetical protein
VLAQCPQPSALKRPGPTSSLTGGQETYAARGVEGRLKARQRLGVSTLAGGGAMWKLRGRKPRTGRAGGWGPAAQVGGEMMTSDRLDRLGVCSQPGLLGVEESDQRGNCWGSWGPRTFRESSLRAECVLLGSRICGEGRGQSLVPLRGGEIELASCFSFKGSGRRHSGTTGGRAVGAKGGGWIPVILLQ